MAFVNFELLEKEGLNLHRQFNAAKPFRFVVIDGILSHAAATEALGSFPPVTAGIWNRTTYINQRKKLQSSEVTYNAFFEKLFAELNGERTLAFLEKLSGMPNLTGDDLFFGAGFHQSVNGAFLDVHVDFNVHPDKKLYRRLNLLIFLNPDWKSEYGGELELWDMEANRCAHTVQPAFNRCVIFETTEKSFHGHPAALRVPEGVTRKSLAAYYYTELGTDDATQNAPHNSVFKNTTGIKGKVKNLLAGLAALKERMLNKLS